MYILGAIFSLLTSYIIYETGKLQGYKNAINDVDKILDERIQKLNDVDKILDERFQTLKAIYEQNPDNDA